jgi:hypothetical protein
MLALVGCSKRTLDSMGARNDGADPRRSGVLYWTLVIVLVGFGLVAIFSIGIPFLLFGLTLAAIGPWRDRAIVVWPAVSAVSAFVVGVLGTLPWSCGRSVMPVSPGGTGRLIRSQGSCSTALGLFRYHTATPGYWPGLVVSLVLAIAAGFAVHAIVARRHRARAEGRPHVTA